MHKSLKQAFILIGVAFALLFTATFFTVKIAFAGHTPPVDANYYEKGLKYDQTVASQKEMLAKGYELNASWFQSNHSLKPGKQNVEVRFFKGKDPVSGAEVLLKLERTATDSFNRTILLEEKQKGVYAGEINIPFPELWRLGLSAKTKEGMLEQTRRVRIEP